MLLLFVIFIPFVFGKYECLNYASCDDSLNNIFEPCDQCAIVKQCDCEKPMELSGKGWYKFCLEFPSTTNGLYFEIHDDNNATLYRAINMTEFDNYVCYQINSDINGINLIEEQKINSTNFAEETRRTTTRSTTRIRIVTTNIPKQSTCIKLIGYKIIGQNPSERYSLCKTASIFAWIGVIITISPIVIFLILICLAIGYSLKNRRN
jgi:hypothetical protein